MAGQLWASSTQGGYRYSPLLTKEVTSAAQPKARFVQFCEIREEWGKNAGETFLFDKAGNISTQGGTLAETDTVPSRDYRLYQSTATLRERGELFATLLDSCRDILKPFLPTDVITERIQQWTIRMDMNSNWLISPGLLTAREQ